MVSGVPGPAYGPAATTLGASFLDWDDAAGIIRFAFAPRPEFANSMGAVHGGFLAAMLETTLVGAANAALDASSVAVTVDLSLSFMRGAAMGTLVGEGWIVNRGRTLCFVEGDIRPEGADAPSVRGTLTALVRPNPNAPAQS